ncbi:hypothetical protein DHEL01_v207766 [Diaporthe helianthi]|uniref:ZZ-type domain-containing protein n=1 Tax=Diaporthe helianthi TaxID=158607 RepID=A0A2P5HUC4_DIAHE|nr:hypothetical protein DHEL01_v207766 [Diaporthe helianthi]
MSLLQYSEFSYAPLPTRTSIRLLRLHNTRNGVLPSLCGYPILHCSLHVVDLASESAPAYEALSYTWDSPETEYEKRKTDNWKDPYGPLCKWPVAVRNGNTGELAVLHVRKNLFDALLHLQGMENVDQRDGEYDKTRLHVAAEDGDTDIVRSMLEEGASCGARDCFGETPLHYAAENGHYEIVKLLIASGADMSVYDNTGRSPVQCCIQRKRGDWEQIARFLRDVAYRTQELRDFDGGDLEVERRSAPYNKTPLIEASEEGKLARVRRLVRRGADLSATDDFGETGLHYAAENGHYDVVKELVRAGADMDVVDGHGRTPIECCTQQKRRQWEEVAKFLRDRSFRQQELSLSAAAAEAEVDQDSDSDSGSEGDVKNEAKGSASGFFWIDALCINQADLDERSAQVQIMPQIYTKASCVIVWLGDDSQMIFRLLRNVWSRPDLKEVIRRVNKKARRLNELKEQWSVSLLAFLEDKNLDWEIPDGAIFSINDLRLILGTFPRSWFTRVWCIQELSLATKIRMFMGKTELEWHEVLKFLCLLAHLGFFRPASVWKIDKGWTMHDGKGGDGSEAWRLAEIRLRTARNNNEWDIVDPIFHRKGCEAPCVRKADRLSLPLLIAATWSFESKDPRDKIYAIMSLAAPLPPEDKITVDYTSPVEDLYTQVAHIFIRGSGRDSMYSRGDGFAGILEPLEGLSYVQDPYYSGQQGRMPELPSWVPDFSNALTTTRIWRRSFRAAKTLEPAFGPGEEKGSLHVLGTEIDVVEAVEPGWAEIDPDDMPADLDIDVGSWLELLETMKPTSGESPVQMLFRTLTVDKLWEGCDKEARQQSAVSFREFIAWELACIVKKSLEEDEEAARELEEETQSTTESGADTSADDDEDEEKSETSSADGSHSEDESEENGKCWTCDGCDRELGAGDWHCDSCEDFDLCWECFRDGKLEHDPKHDFTLYQVSPNEEPSTAPQEQVQVPSRLTKVLRSRSALGSSAFGSTESLSLKQKAVIKRISQLRIGRWFGDHGEAPNTDSKDSVSGQDQDDRSSTGSSASNKESEDLTNDATDASLKQSSLYILEHQRSLENAANQGDLRYLPTLDEIPSQDRLTGATWQWCKFHGDPSGCKTLDDESSVRVHISKVYRKRCLFRTRAGRLGLGPQSVRPGDGVWLVAGSRTPYLLRNKEQAEEGKEKLGFLGIAQGNLPGRRKEMFTPE